MPWQLRLFMIVPLLVLAARVHASRDAQWKRAAAAVFILVAALAQPLLMQLIEARDPWSGGYGALQILHAFAFYGAGLVLLAWAFASRDPASHRIASAAVGLFGLGPVILTLVGSAPAMLGSGSGR